MTARNPAWTPTVVGPPSSRHDKAIAGGTDFGNAVPITGDLPVAVVSTRTMFREEGNIGGQVVGVGVVGLLVDQFNDGAAWGLLEIKLEAGGLKLRNVQPAAGDLHVTAVAHR